MKTAVVYRTEAKSLKSDVDSYNYNESDIPQFEVCIFSGGKTAQRWLTPTGSMVWWDCWEDLCKVHIYAHPDYGTKVIWDDETVEQL